MTTHPDTAVGSGALADRVEAELVGTTPGEWRTNRAGANVRIYDDDRLVAVVSPKLSPAANARAIVALHNLAREIVSTLRAQEAEIARLQEVLTFDCTGYPGMEDKAIEWANRISGPRGSAPMLLDPVGILEMCEEIAAAALSRPSSAPSDGDGA